MGAVERNCVGLDVVVARVVGQIVGVVKYLRLGGNAAGSVAKIVNFVHVQPQSVELQFAVEEVEHVQPVLGGVGVEVVHKYRIARPYFPHEVRSVCIPRENSSFETLLIGIANSLDSRVDDGNPLVLLPDLG